MSHKKIVIIGNSGVGKSSLIEYIVRGHKSKYHDKCPTIGASFLTWNVRDNLTDTKYEIWDTAGQERFRAIVPMYLRNTHLILLVYDATDYNSYLDAKDYWINYIHETLNHDIPPIIIIENKIDHESQLHFDTKLDHLVCKTSAHTGEGIQELRDKIIEITKDKFNPTDFHNNLQLLNNAPPLERKCCI
jgi:small GTP-binding protein